MTNKKPKPVMRTWVDSTLSSADDIKTRVAEEMMKHYGYGRRSQLSQWNKAITLTLAEANQHLDTLMEAAFQRGRAEARKCVHCGAYCDTCPTCLVKNGMDGRMLEEARREALQTASEVFQKRSSENVAGLLDELEGYLDDEDLCMSCNIDEGVRELIAKKRGELA